MHRSRIVEWLGCRLDRIIHHPLRRTRADGLLQALVGGILVDTGGVEGNDVAVGARHGSGLHLSCTSLSRDDVGLLRPGDLLCKGNRLIYRYLCKANEKTLVGLTKFRHDEGAEESEDSDRELHFD